MASICRIMGRMLTAKAMAACRLLSMPLVRAGRDLAAADQVGQCLQRCGASNRVSLRINSVNLARVQLASVAA